MQKFNNVIGVNFLREVLSIGVMEINFTKKDGTDRKIVCTLDCLRIPVEDTPKKTREWTSTEILPVYDLENKGWRSIRLESIKTMSLLTKKTDF